MKSTVELKSGDLVLVSGEGNEAVRVAEVRGTSVRVEWDGTCRGTEWKNVDQCTVVWTTLYKRLGS